MKKLLPKLLLGAAGVWVGSMLIYWFNLDNKAIYFLVRRCWISSTTTARSTEKV